MNLSIPTNYQYTILPTTKILSLRDGGKVIENYEDRQNALLAINHPIKSGAVPSGAVLPTLSLQLSQFMDLVAPRQRKSLGGTQTIIGNLGRPVPRGG